MTDEHEAERTFRERIRGDFVPPPEDEPSHPWEQMDGESAFWYKRFQRYLLTEGKRSILGTVNDEREEKGRKRSNNIPGSWWRASQKYDWTGRAEAYDLYQVELAKEEWRRRQKEIREREWAMSEALLDKAQQMLEFPLAEMKREQTSRGGQVQNTTIVKPSKWSFSDVTRFVETVSKLARLSVEMETEHHKHDHHGKVGVIPIDIEDGELNQRIEDLFKVAVNSDDEFRQVLGEIAEGRSPGTVENPGGQEAQARKGASEEDTAGKGRK